MTTLEELAARVESASADEQRWVLEQVWKALHDGVSAVSSAYGPTEDAAWRRARQFLDMLAANAYESAALMLVPEGWTGLFSAGRRPLETAWLLPRSGRMDPGVRVEAATLALAITAASLRAQAKEQQQ